MSTEVLSHPGCGNSKCWDRSNNESKKWRQWGSNSIILKNRFIFLCITQPLFKNNVPTKVSTHFTTFIIKYSNFKSSDFSCLKTPLVDRDTVRLPAGLKPSAGFHRMSETTGWREMLGDETHYMHRISSLQRKCFKEFLRFVKGVFLPYIVQDTPTVRTLKIQKELTPPYTVCEVRGQALQYWGDHSVLSWYSAQV